MADDTVLRDQLARDRTVLANERTLLAYGRTTLALVGLAVVIFKFGNSDSDALVGVLSLTAAFVVFFWGMHSYRRVAARIGHTTTRENPDLVLIETD